MGDFFIRKAVKEDAEQIHIIETQCFEDPWSTNSILDDICKNQQAYYLVCVGHQQGKGDFVEKVLGYVGVWKILDEGHITNVAVSKEARRQHIGSGLIEALITDLAQQGIEKTTLEVRESNEPAIGLYEKFGFEKIGRRKGYYSNGENAIIMWRGYEEL